MYGEVPDSGREDEECVYEYQDESQLCRTHSSVSQFELALEMGVDIYGNGQQEVDYQDRHCDAEVHYLRQTCSYAYHRCGDPVDAMVKVEAVDRTLGVAYPGEGAVKGVAVPVDDVSCR